ncbi:hypothetical protein ACFL02_08690 [Planctomycetota bacterium]
MSNAGNIVKNIKSLHNIIISQHKSRRNRSGIKWLNRFMSEIKGSGIIERADHNGKKGSYLLIDGNSWQNACRQLKRSAVPNFVMWEEGEFYSFLKSQLMVTGRNRAKSDLKVNNKSAGAKRLSANKGANQK